MKDEYETLFLWRATPQFPAPGGPTCQIEQALYSALSTAGENSHRLAIRYVAENIWCSNHQIGRLRLVYSICRAVNPCSVYLLYIWTFADHEISKCTFPTTNFRMSYANESAKASDETEVLLLITRIAPAVANHPGNYQEIGRDAQAAR